LIDDFSDRVELQGKLERYIETQLPSIVRLVRLKERQGLIRARLAGAKEATGEVIIFLDSHCEVIKFIFSHSIC
jgi:polypeptide N-acetylgalactosaminyltransferase